MAKGIILTAAEEKLAALLWEIAPISSPELVSRAEIELSWKKSTTYTILKKLCDKGVFKNERAHVSVLLSRDELAAKNSRSFVEDTFGGSLPRFIASFIGGEKLSARQAAEIRKLIEVHEEGEGG